MEMFDLHAFRQWLEQRCGQYVGCGVDAQACPLAVWLSERFETPYAVGVDRALSREDAQSQSTPLPAWARVFVRLLDARYPRAWVTGERALAVLDEVDEVVR
jgi:hypothetical protein